MRRPLSRFRQLACVPLGVLWLGVMAVIAVPVILAMTVLYYLHLVARAITAGRRAAPDASRDES